MRLEPPKKFHKELEKLNKDFPEQNDLSPEEYLNRHASQGLLDWIQKQNDSMAEYEKQGIWAG